MSANLELLKANVNFVDFEFDNFYGFIRFLLSLRFPINKIPGINLFLFLKGD